MELVRGIKITDYCAQNHLSTGLRLRLFIQICHAIQHAHQKGIIHRDIKPSNILVTLHDGVPVPKVIDFGIAKAITDQQLTDKTVFTAFEQFLGTPAYMSPEQAEMSGLDVDTRSDIYSLGVLLYELLTGVTPLDARELKRAGLDEMRRLICEKDPVPPSTRLTQLRHQAQPQSPIAHCQGPAVPAKSGTWNPQSEFETDLDWIVMKCLEKDRTRRYATANGLAADLQRYLDNEPVAARPPSAAYRFRKAFRRHKVAFTAAGAVVLSLLLGIAGSLWQAVRAHRAEREALTARTEAVAAGANEQAQRYVAEQEKLNAENARALAERQLYAANMNEARLAFEENNFARLRKILKQTADDPNRGFEWYYWQRQAHLDLKTLRGHLAPVVAVACSPDGRRIVTGSFDHTARIWDADEGTELLVLRGHRREVRAVAFSPDGRRVVTGSADRTARVWDVATGREQSRLEGHTGWVTSVAFSPDDRRIVTGSLDGTVRLWDADTGQPLPLPVLDLGNWVWTVAFSNDGRWVLTGSGDETARLWDAATGEESACPPIQPPSAHNPALGPINRGVMPFTAAFSADDRYVVTGSQDQTVRVWDRETGREPFPLRGKPHWLSPMERDIPLALTISLDGRWLVTGRLDRTAEVWSLAGRTNLFTLRGHEAQVAAVAFSPDGKRIVTGSYDHTAKVWDATRSRESLRLDGHTRTIPGAKFSPEGQRIVTVSWDGTARVWEFATGRLLHVLRDGETRLWTVAFSPDGKWIITGGDDGLVRAWDAASAKLVRTFPGSTREISSLAFFPDGRRILSSGNDRKATIQDATTGEIQAEFEETERSVRAAVSPDGQRIVTVSESTDVLVGGLRTLSAGADGIVSTLFRGSAHVWEVASRKKTPLAGQTGGISSVAFSPDGRRIIAGTMDGTASVWDAATGREQPGIKGHSDRVIFTAFMPGGRRILTAGFDSGTTRIWDPATRQELLTLHGHPALAVSPDGRRIVAGGYPPAIVLEAASEEEVAAWAREEQVARERIDAERAERQAAAERIREAGI